MSKLQLKAKNKRKFKVTTDSNHKLPIHKNIINRDFTATDINQKWFSDISYIDTNEGWLFLAIVLDVYSRAIIGWSMDKTMTKELVCDALNMALWRRHFPRGVIIHSDRGSQYCSKEYQNMLNNNQFICSMSRRGNCWDNSPMERVFRSLKSEWIPKGGYHNLGDAKADIVDYLMRYYNEERPHSYNGGLPPNESERLLSISSL